MLDSMKKNKQTFFFTRVNEGEESQDQGRKLPQTKETHNHTDTPKK